MRLSREMQDRFESEFTIADVRALKEASQRSKRALVMEDASLDKAAALLYKFVEVFGRKGVIALLKGVRFINDYIIGIGSPVPLPVLGGRKMLVKLKDISSAQVDKAIEYLKDKTGISVPFTGTEFMTFVEYAWPTTWLDMAIEELIYLLSDMTDEEYKKQASNIKNAERAKRIKDLKDKSEKESKPPEPTPPPATGHPPFTVLPGGLDPSSDLPKGPYRPHLAPPRRVAAVSESKLWLAIKKNY